MSSENIIILLIAILAAVGAFVDIEYVPLGLVLLGLVAGFMNASTDMAERTGMLLVALALPIVANQLDAIPVAGTYLNTFCDGVAGGVAGMYLANFAIALYGRIKPA